MNSHLQFQYPWVLGLLALLPVYAFWRGRAGRSSAIRFSSADLVRAVANVSRSAAGRFVLFLRLLGISLCLVALAGPRLAYDYTEKEASGVDIMLVLDMSWSMMALDMSGPRERTSRMDIAQSVMEDFIRRRPSDRIGLVVFSGVPYLVSPLTLNHEWLIQNLQRLHIGMIRELGTAIGDATATAVKRLKALKQSKSRLIILLTDGDNNRGELDPVPAADLAAALNTKLYTIGIGKEEPCMLPAFEPSTGRLRLDPAGHTIDTIALEPANYHVLGQMARIARGQFYRATNQRELAGIYHDIDRLEKTEVKLRRYTTYVPLFQWPLMAAFCLLTVELVLDYTRYRRVP
jgi:Ca-activated chloride channel homolog